MTKGMLAPATDAALLAARTLADIMARRGCRDPGVLEPPRAPPAARRGSANGLSTSSIETSRQRLVKTIQKEAWK